MTYSQEVAKSQRPHGDTHPLILSQTKEEVGRIDSDALNEEASQTVTSDINRKDLAGTKVLAKEK